jgi:hypothetical protein
MVSAQHRCQREYDGQKSVSLREQERRLDEENAALDMEIHELLQEYRSLSEGKR